MIEKVRTIWITGFLRQSLFREVRVILGLSERPDAVARPLDLLVRRPDRDDRPLPHGTEVVDVFDDMDHSLLILGAPGAGARRRFCWKWPATCSTAQRRT
jgi:hypothetical protein